MMNTRTKISENDSPAHQTLRFTQGCGIDHIFMIRTYVYFITKYNSVELIKALKYYDKLLIVSSVVTLWID